MLPLQRSQSMLAAPRTDLRPNKLDYERLPFVTWGLG
jgi:hypothetical protein